MPIEEFPHRLSLSGAARHPNLGEAPRPPQARGGSCWSVQVLPSGSSNVTNRPQA